MERPFEAYEGDEPYVFVCYSHDDKALVYPEITRLKSSGFRIWYDEGVSPGSEWSDAIARKIERSTVVLYFVTPQSVSSEHCRREVNFALGKSCRILSVHLVPTELPRGLELSLSNRQAILKYDEPRSTYEAKVARAIGDARSRNAGTSTSDRRDPITTRRRHVGRLTGVAVALVIAVGLALWLSSRPTGNIPAFDRSVAVMPFSVIGGDAEMTTYADALTEELRTDVAGYQELRSVAVEDATHVRQVNDASYVVVGNVQRLRDSVRVRASMTRTDDHQTVWAKTFERAAADATGDPAEMASTLGRFVRQNLVQDQQCESVKRSSHSEQAAAAYCAALAERARFSQGGDLDLGLELRNAQRAIALDPNIADAYRIVAYNYTVQGFLGLMDWQAAAREAHLTLDRGLALAPNDPQLLTAQGELQGDLEFDRPAAAASIRASLASDPLQPYAYRNYAELARLAFGQGNLSDAAENYRRALRIYDGDAAVYLAYASILSAWGQSREAIRAADTGLRLIQSGWLRAYLLLIKAYAYDALGQTAEANKAIDDGLSSAGPMYRPPFAGILAKVGRRDEAYQILAPLERLEHPPIDAMVFAYTALGDDRVFDWIHAAIDHHITNIVNTIRTGTIYSEELRKDPRWAEVMAHLEEEAKGRGQHQSSS